MGNAVSERTSASNVPLPVEAKQLYDEFRKLRRRVETTRPPRKGSVEDREVQDDLRRWMEYVENPIRAWRTQAQAVIQAHPCVADKVKGLMDDLKQLCPSAFLS